MTDATQTETQDIPIPASTGKAVQVPAGTCFSVVAAEGPQVADMWAFACDTPHEFLSTEHTRSCLDRLTPRVGDAFYSNMRRPILTVMSDTSPGCHDLLLSACDEGRYRLLGHTGPHRSCVDNLREALSEASISPTEIPSPVNVFESVEIAPDGTLEIVPPKVKQGQSLTLRAEIDVIVVISACPMDIVPTNGTDLTPKSLIFKVPVDRPA